MMAFFQCGLLMCLKISLPGLVVATGGLAIKTTGLSLLIRSFLFYFIVSVCFLISTPFNLLNRTCRNIVALALDKGRIPPCFFEQCAHGRAFKEMNMMNIGGNNLTTKEISLWLSEVRFDENLNIDYCFAGAVKVENLEAISHYYYRSRRSSVGWCAAF